MEFCEAFWRVACIGRDANQEREPGYLRCDSYVEGATFKLKLIKHATGGHRLFFNEVSKTKSDDNQGDIILHAPTELRTHVGKKL